MKLTVSDIVAASDAALRAHGAGAWQAGEVAKAIGRAEATGNVICGLYYLESYCQQLVSGRVSGQVDPEVRRMRPGHVEVDAKLGFAQPAFAQGLPVATAAAGECGIALFSVTHAHTCTSLGYFTEQIAEAGMIGLGFTNASAIVAPPGGKSRVLGTNPIAVTIPGENGPAMHADFSTAAIALGKITMAKAAGENIPLGWAVDRDGNPTTDPAAALEGSLVSAAAYKGWALGLLVEFLAAGLTGCATSTETSAIKAPSGSPHNLAQTYILIDPADRQVGLNDLAERIRDAIASDGDVRIPGSPRKDTDHPDIDAVLWEKVLLLAKA